MLVNDKVRVTLRAFHGKYREARTVFQPRPDPLDAVAASLNRRAISRADTIMKVNTGVSQPLADPLYILSYFNERSRRPALDVCCAVFLQ